MKWALGVAGVLITIGIVATVIDYRQWKRRETQNFGQGWADLQEPAKPLTYRYTDSGLGVTMELPDGLEVGKQISLRAGSGSEVGVKKLTEEEPGGRAVVHQVMGKDMGEKIVVLEVRIGEEEWGQWEKTIQAVFESIQMPGT